ncbi:MAG: NAD(P)H-dependent glycerol-3-phosphate dehydrogenase [Candidatus Eisenbacteria bacterium]|nr:NAD(P)H-dependent glycerol-3-phosphate dehydrogenase [Candidatus Latescibacterota bacterium]MBD3301249.1 NAD(P)H-dependent glycerol-3-phosphate dehydrogenase [Candidatus Eisenbacteria bacterium]
MDPVCVLGAGSWGTSLGLLLARRGIPVRLRERTEELATEMETARENRNFLPGFRFPDPLHVMYDMQRALDGCRFAVLAVPSQVLPEVLELVPAERGTGPIWVIATKGLDERTGERMSTLVARRWPEARIAVLAGPSLAREVAAGQPTTVLSAAREVEIAEAVRDRFHGPTFRVYTSDDPVGVEVGTALKNVVALAAGIAEGMGLGANAHGALLTRGLAEITRLGAALGANRETFLGLAGVGDLVTTCSSPLSRNRSLGEAIGRGTAPEAARKAMDQVAEGVPTTRSAVRLARRHGVEMPIATQVHRILFEGIPPGEALRELMERPPKAEEAAG